MRGLTRNLKMSYDPDNDILWLRDGCPSDGSSLLEDAPFATIEMRDEESREAVGVEISGSVPISRCVGLTTANQQTPSLSELDEKPLR